MLIALVVVGGLILTAVIALPVWLFYKLFFGWLYYWHMFVFMVVGEAGCVWISWARNLRERSLVVRVIEQIVFGVLFIFFVAFLTDKILYSQDAHKQSSQNTRNTVFVNEAKAIDIATIKAKELGYSVKKMNVRSKIMNDEAVTYFGPKTLQFGGDLTIKVDMKHGSITDVIRGH